jgi:effector-binding domain-containing protein
MRKLIISIILIAFTGLSIISQELAPYIKVGETTETMQQTYDKVITTLKDNSFTVLDAYNPSGKSSLKVIAFTRTDLKNTVVKVADRGALATVFKVGLVKKNGKVTISYTNPDYILRAYLRSNYNTYKSIFQKFSADLKICFAGLGSDFTPFGGTVKADKLKKYHYMAMMPYFTDPVELNEFASFEEGLALIEKNLKAKKGNTVKVYKVVYKSKKIAVFGVGLKNKEVGESYFLPIIGESHIAAMPYEIILQGNKATMLHGKYRLALHWPELTMGTFMKIMSTPGDIEDTLSNICK